MDSRLKAENIAKEWEQDIAACWDKIGEIEKIDPQLQDNENQKKLLGLLEKLNELLVKYLAVKGVEIAAKEAYLISQIKRATDQAKKVLGPQENLHIHHLFGLTSLYTRIYSNYDLIKNKDFIKSIERSRAAVNELEISISEFKKLCPSTWQILENLKVGSLTNLELALRKFAYALLFDKKFPEAFEYFQFARQQNKLILQLAEQAQKAPVDYFSIETKAKIAEVPQTLTEIQLVLSNAFASYAKSFPDKDIPQKIKFYKAAIEELESAPLLPEVLKRMTEIIEVILARWRNNLALVFVKQAYALEKEGKFPEVIERYRDAINISMQIPKEFIKKDYLTPLDYQVELSEFLDGYADNLMANKKYEEAIKIYQAEIDLLNKIASQSSDLVKITKLDQAQALHEKIALALPLWINQIKETAPNKHREFSKSDEMERLKKEVPSIWRKLKAEDEKSKPQSKKLAAPTSKTFPTAKPPVRKTFLTEKKVEEKKEEVAKSPTIRRRKK